MPALSPRSDRPSPRLKSCSKTSAEKKQGRVMVIGDSRRSGREAPICRPEPLFREVGCLPGVRSRDVTTRRTSLGQPSDCYPLLLFHVGAHEVARRGLRPIQRRFRALGRRRKKSGAQAAFTSILPVRRNCEKLWKKQASPRHQHLAPGLVPPPKLQRFKLRKSLGGTRYAGARWDEPVLMVIFGHRLVGLTGRALS